MEPTTAPTLVTEKTYPITKRWIFKTPLILLLINLVLLVAAHAISGRLFFAMIIALICTPVLRAHFHFTLGDKFLDIKQGFFSKKTRHLPYGVIQTVFVKQDIADRILGIAGLTVEDASYAGAGKKSGSFKLTAGRSRGEAIGGSGSKINIPGLKKADAEALKMLILKKMEENPIEDSQSGL